MIKRLIGKQIFRSFVKIKDNIVFLWLIMGLSSFIYFFVQCSIDGNIDDVLGKDCPELLTALESNHILANTFLICFACILCFLFYLFYRRFFDTQSSYIGYYETLGVEKKDILSVYLFYLSLIIITGHLAGMVLGYYASSVLIASYKTIYHVDDLVRGMKLRSMLAGIIFPLALLLLLACWVCSGYLKKPVSALLGSNREKKEKVLAFANYVSRFFRGKNAFGIRTALRRPMSVLLLVLAVFLFDLLFLFSFSLNMSSRTVYESQLAGRTFQYEYETDALEEESRGHSCDYYLRLKGEIIAGQRSFSQEITGLDNNQYFTLMENGNIIGRIIPEGVVINRRMHDIYHINTGDTVLIEIGGKQIRKTIMAIAENAGLDTVYVNKESLSEELGINSRAYNGIWSDNFLSNVQGRVISMAEYQENLEMNNVSNRLSAVICQLLAVMIGCLLLYMSVLLNFEENFDGMVKLRILGYRGKEINHMLVSVYRPVLTAGFFLTLYPCLLTGRAISDGLSYQTGDYMPFQSGMAAILSVFVLMNVFYSVIKLMFTYKVNKVILSESWMLS